MFQPEIRTRGGEGILPTWKWRWKLVSRGYLRRATQTGILFAVQLPQKALIERVVSSKIVVECDMQTC